MGIFLVIRVDRLAHRFLVYTPRFEIEYPNDCLRGIWSNLTYLTFRA